MNILELNIYNTLCDIEAEKSEANIEPTHTLIVQDNLLDRVSSRIGSNTSKDELSEGLIALYEKGKIVLGNTINDIYIKVVYN